MWHAKNTPEWSSCRRRPPNPRGFKLQLAAVQSVVNQVNHSLNGMGIRKGRELGEEGEITRERGTAAPTPLGFQDQMLDWDLMEAM